MSQKIGASLDTINNGDYDKWLPIANGHGPGSKKVFLERRNNSGLLIVKQHAMHIGESPVTDIVHLVI